MKLIGVFLLLAIWMPGVLGSWGDTDYLFRKCLQHCNQHRCEEELKTAEIVALTYVPPAPTIHLSCKELCTYGCIEESFLRRKKLGEPEVKYYGHWRFIRYFGLEEPASVIGSVFNAVPHMLYFLRSWFAQDAPCYMKHWLRAYALVATIAWLSSSFYHAKKTEQSTHWDLISALGFIMFGFLMAVRRIRGTSAQPARMALLFVTVFLGWGVRALSMLRGEVSFNSHMTVSIAFVVLTTLLWMGWVLHTLLFVANKAEGQAKYLCVLCQVWLFLASALEIFDFAPIFGIFDAHSLWHLATIPLGFLWYRFWALDKAIRLAPVAREVADSSDGKKLK